MDMLMQHHAVEISGATTTSCGWGPAGSELVSRRCCAVSAYANSTHRSGTASIFVHARFARISTSLRGIRPEARAASD
jgi:hypothetical protein